jgi:predicted flap endonuclease-1-like 5' DNA nuclease
MLTSSALSIVLFFSSAALFGYLLHYYTVGYAVKKQNNLDMDDHSVMDSAIQIQPHKNQQLENVIHAFIDSEGIVYQLQCENNQLKKNIELIRNEKPMIQDIENGRDENSKLIVKELLSKKESLQKNNDDLSNTLASLESQFRDLFEKSSEKNHRYEIQLTNSEKALKEQTAINETLTKQVDELYKKLDKDTINRKTKAEKNEILSEISALNDPTKNISNNVKAGMIRLREEEKTAMAEPPGKNQKNGQQDQLLQASEILGLKVKGNDLKLIEGIGPKIEALFHKAGIKTWHDLAATSVSRCREILLEGGERFQIHNPATWPRQSKLLADAKWKQLKEYQLNLSRGKETIK